MIDRNWQKELEPIMRGAGELLLSFYGKKLKKTIKPKNGFATEADIASEQFLIAELKKLLPEASFYAEESGKSGSDSDYCWVIDPLDGTTDFAHQIPYWCISVALTHNTTPIMGAIYAPMQDEYFYAQQGKGAWCNGKPIQVSEPEKFSDALIGIGVPYATDERLPVVKLAQKVVRQAFGVRYFGSIALDLANLASGRLDGVVLMHLAWWDVAAGIVILEEAGGKITDFEGNSLDPDYKTAFAGGKLVYTNLMNLVK